MQTSASQLIVTHSKESAELNTDLQISGTALGNETLAVWSGKVMAVYQVVPVSSINVIGKSSSSRNIQNFKSIAYM